MGARHFTELIAWQLADDLRRFVFDHTSEGAIAQDWKFRAQLRGASDGVCRNIAEGFGRYGHRDFAWFMTIAKGSLDEAEDALVAAHRRRYVDDETFEAGLRKIKRTNKAVLGLLRCLRHSEGPDPRPRPDLD